MTDIPEHIVERVARAIGYELGFGALPQDRLSRIARAAIEALGGEKVVMDGLPCIVIQLGQESEHG